jgi:hypothetical protein
VGLIIQMDKAWFTKAKKAGSNDRECGLSFKILQMEITPKSQKKTLEQMYSKYGFIKKGNKEDEEEGMTIDL